MKRGEITNSLLKHYYNATSAAFIAWATYILLMWFSKRKFLVTSFGMKAVSKCTWFVLNFFALSDLCK